MLPGQDMGTREIDRDYDWSIHVGRYNIHPEVWDQMKAENPVEQVVEVDSSLDSLTLEQRKLYDTVVSQYSNELIRQPLPQLLLHVDGVAGSGKTFVLLKRVLGSRSWHKKLEGRTLFFGQPLQVSRHLILLGGPCMLCYGSRSREGSLMCRFRRCSPCRLFSGTVAFLLSMRSP
jgi:hypothetical protein